jgi:hypothetical protein
VITVAAALPGARCAVALRFAQRSGYNAAFASPGIIVFIVCNWHSPSSLCVRKNF